MTQDQYRDFWRNVSREPIAPPIPYTCPKCQYEGQIARVCDVPGYCLYCGHELAHGECERLGKAVRTAMDRKADREIEAWRRMWTAPEVADANAQDTVVECDHCGHDWNPATHDICPRCEDKADLYLEIAKDNAAEGR